MNLPKIAIIYLSYNPKPYLDRVISAWQKMSYPKNSVEIVVVDNPHPQYGSAGSFLREKLLPLSGDVLPKVTILENSENLGFAGGNNVGVDYALENNFDLIFFHNQDGFLGIECLERLARVFNEDGAVAAVSPLILLYPDHDLINTCGNKIHYLGFGYCGCYRQPALDAPQNLQEINYGSGAALMVRAGLLKKYGGFDVSYFAYHEDLELSLRLRSLGYKIMLLPSARFYHEYSFSRNPDKFYLMERNRLSLIFSYYRLATIILLAPIFLITEIGILFYAFLGGWGKQKIKALTYWFKDDNFTILLNKRRQIQTYRQVSDKVLLQNMVADINFEGISNNFIINKVVNPIFKFYFYLAKLIIFW